MKYVKRVDELTQEQKDAMADYAKKWIDIGLKTGETDFETFDKYMPICYEKAKLAYPKNVVRVKSPLVGALASSVAEAILKKKRSAVGSAVGDAINSAVGSAVGGAVNSAVEDAVGDAVRDAVRGAVRNAVGSAVDDAVNSAVGGAVDDAVNSAVGDAVGDAVGGAVNSAVDDAVWGAVRGAVGGAVRGAVDGAVGDAVGGAVDDAVGGAVGGAVGDAVGGAVDGAVWGAVRGAVGGAVRGAVGGAVDGAVGGAVWGAVDDAVRGAVGDAVGGAVDDAVKTAISIAKKVGVTLSWHYWLGGQFWVGYWWYGVSAVNFLFDVCKLKLSKDIMERAEAYRKVCESVNYIWANRDFVMVCERPIRISRNNQGRLHSDTAKSIEYSDGWGLYHLNGVLFPEAIWTKVVSKKMPFSEIMAIVDVDQRTQAMKYGDFHEFAKHQKATMLDEKTKLDVNGDTVKYELWKFNRGDIFLQDVFFMWYQCPSTRNEYTSGVWESKTVAEAMARKQGITEEMWELMIPLRDES